MMSSESNENALPTAGDTTLAATGAAGLAAAGCLSSENDCNAACRIANGCVEALTGAGATIRLPLDACAVTEVGRWSMASSCCDAAF